MPKVGFKHSEETRRRMSKTHTGKKKPWITVPVADRLSKQCNKNGPIHPVLRTRCWVWQGAEFKGTGYGQIQVGKRPTGVHRASWEVHYGPIPKGVFVLHKCDNRKCMRPDHLFLGSQQDNVDDMITKGRKRVSSGQSHSVKMKLVAARGENHGHATLTDQQVLEIRTKHTRGKRGVKGSGNTAQLASEYRVHPTHILAISRGAIRRAARANRG